MYISLFYLAVIGMLVSSISSFIIYRFFLVNLKISSTIKVILGALCSIVICFLLKDILFFGGNIYWLTITLILSVLGYFGCIAIYKKSIA